MKSKHFFKSGNGFIWIALIMMGVLFVSSSQTYEQQSQIGLLRTLLKNEPFKELLRTVSFDYAGSPVSLKTNGYFSFVEFFIRKGAHFGTYFVLGGSWFLGLAPRVKNIGLTGVVAWLAATGYAGLDEFHQMLTGGRTPLFQDVALDSLGALSAVCLCLLVIFIKRLRKVKK